MENFDNNEIDNAQNLSQDIVPSEQSNQQNTQPDGQYQQPNQQNTQPDGQYQQPDQQYAQPDGQYQQPNQQYTQPNGQYQQPNQQYAQPDGQYQQPNQQYTQPNGQYQQPNQQYQQPNQQYQYQQPQYALKSKIAGGLLGIFLGGLGVHNFYLGYTGKAIAQLLISVLSCGVLSPISIIWGLIEGILILAGSIAVDGKGYPLVD